MPNLSYVAHYYYYTLQNKLIPTGNFTDQPHKLSPMTKQRLSNRELSFRYSLNNYNIKADLSVAKSTYIQFYLDSGCLAASVRNWSNVLPWVLAAASSACKGG